MLCPLRARGRGQDFNSQVVQKSHYVGPLTLLYLLNFAFWLYVFTAFSTITITISQHKYKIFKGSYILSKICVCKRLYSRQDFTVCQCCLNSILNKWHVLGCSLINGTSWLVNAIYCCHFGSKDAVLHLF